MKLATNKKKNSIIADLYNANHTISGKIKLEYEVTAFDKYNMTYTIKAILLYKHTDNKAGIAFTPYLKISSSKKVGNRFNCGSGASKDYIKIHEMTFSASLENYALNAVLIAWGTDDYIYDYIHVTLPSPNFGISKISGKYKYTIVYIKIDGQWRRAMAYIKKNNNWPEAGDFRYYNDEGKWVDTTWSDWSENE